MRLLVTGAAGYIGSIVAELAIHAGHQVVALDDLRGGHRAAIPPACEFVHGSVGHVPSLRRAFGLGPVDAVLHLAAEAAIEPSVTDPALYFEANLVEGLALLEQMRAHRVERLVFSSTAATYGEPTTPVVEEDHPQSPVNAYGESKLMLERAIRWYHRAYGLRAVVFRYFNAAGATSERGEDRPVETHLLPLVLDAAAGRRGPIAVFGTDYPTKDGSAVRDYVHVADIADAHLRALECVDRVGLSFLNIGTGAGSTVLEVIASVERVVGTPVPWARAPRRPGDPAMLVASATRLQQVLGWTPQRSTLDSIIASAWTWRQRHPEGYRSAGWPTSGAGA